MDKCKLLRELSGVQFAAWELHLYLDTHKCDKKAAEMYKKYSQRAAELKAQYEEMCGPLTIGEDSAAGWLKDPWPWEYKECDF